MMPAAGRYELKAITRTQFISLLLQAFEAGHLVNRIGYVQNAKLIESWTGIRLQLSREKTIVKDGDTLLCITLKYRANRKKGDPVDDNDFEFWIAKYQA